MDTEGIARFVISKWTAMSADAQPAFNRFREVLTYLYPAEAYIDRVAGSSPQDDAGDLYDVTAVEANDVLAAGSLAYLTPINEAWFSLEAPEGFPKEDDEGRRWYRECGEVMMRKISASNFYTVIHEIHKHRGAVGIGTIFAKMRGTDFWFKRFKPGTYCISKNEFDEVDTFAERIQLTHTQAKGLFGESNLSEKTRNRLASDDGKNADEKGWYVHLIFPRPDSWRGRDSTGEFASTGESKEFADIYVEEDTKHVCWNSGFDTMPVHVSYWEDDMNDAYGCGPGVKALPVIRSLNRNSAAMDATAELAVDPPLNVPTNSRVPNMSPGAVNRYDENRPDAKIEPLFIPTQYQLGLDQVESKKRQIKAMFYTDHFTAFSDSTKRMQTFEAMQLADEKLALFHSSMARFCTFLERLITRRLFPLLLTTKPRMLPAIPPSVVSWAQSQNRGPEALFPSVAYQSKISMAVRAVRMKGSMSVLQLLPAIQPYDPACAQRINMDEVVKDACLTFGMPSNQIRTDADVKAIRDKMAKAEQEQAQMAMAQQGAATAKDAAQAGLLGRTGT